MVFLFNLHNVLCKACSRFIVGSFVSFLMMSSADCLNACSRDCFSILDTARTKHQLRIKESLFISWLKPTLNKQKSHQYIISLSI